MSKLTLVQKSPDFLDKHKTIQKTVNTIEAAAKNGAELVVFSEAFIPGYPTCGSGD